MKNLLMLGVLLMALHLYPQGRDLTEVRSLLVKYQIKHSEAVLKQAVLETGWFKSYSYRERNNCFGFSVGGQIMKFSSVETCVGYYKQWQDRYYKGGDYYDFLECLWKHKDGSCVRYATDPDYIKKLKGINVINPN